jgi:hypothetical protein
MIRHFAACTILLLGTACGVGSASNPIPANTARSTAGQRAEAPGDAIQRVMVEESLAHADRDQRRTATALARIDLSGTPAEFREAWARYLAAQVELANLAESSNSRETAERLIRAASERSERAQRDYTEVARHHGALAHRQ